MANAYLGGCTVITLSRRSVEIGLQKGVQRHKRWVSREQKKFDAELEERIKRRDELAVWDGKKR